MSQRETTAAPGADEALDASVTGTESASADRDAVLTRLMADHGAAVYGYCVRVLRDRVLAEDVLQQVFLEVHRDLDRFEGRSHIRSWLFGIASHRCQDAIKSRRRRERRFTTDDQAVALAVDTTADPRQPLDVARANQALDDCLGQLSTETRSAVLLRFHAAMSYEEMAEPLGEKADTLRARVCRALPVLRRCLEAKGLDGD
jgi:RNA polymerase sigma-70 factor (ECF subfamily)